MWTRPTHVRRRRRDDWRRGDGGLWLPEHPGALVPRVPMRGGMTRRGMGMGFEPAGCCCGGCGTYYSMEYDYTGQSILVDGSGITNNGGKCLWMNDQYELTDVSASGDYPRNCQVTWSLTMLGSKEIKVTFRIKPEDNTREIIVQYSGPYAYVEFWKGEAGASLYQNTDGATWQLVYTILVTGCTVSSGAVDLTLSA